MTTFTAFTTAPSQSDAEALGLALERLDPEPMGIGVFEIEDGARRWEIGAYFTERPDEVALDVLAAAFGAEPFAVSRLDDRDWVAQVRRELTPVEAGRFVVHGAHDADKIPPQKVALLIEAAMAFGTGHHGTTQGCLLALDDLVRSGLSARHVADIGTGTGVLAMAAARVFPANVIASDIDPVATMTARANMVANGFGARIRTVTSVGFRHEALRRAAPFDLIFANILASPLKRLAHQMALYSAPGGMIILSGLLNTQAQSVISTYAGHGFVLYQKRRIGEWTTLTLRRK